METSNIITPVYKHAMGINVSVQHPTKRYDNTKQLVETII
jgi:hypothetical protein